MGRLNPEKLQVKYLPGADAQQLAVPRYYTLTHSDTTGCLFLTIGPDYDRKQISGLQTRLMRDEVLAELVEVGDSMEFRFYCHVSGGCVVGRAGWRYSIFKRELPLVLEAIRYGDRNIFEQNPELDRLPVCIHFKSTNSKYNKVEKWGVMADYRQI